MSTAVKRILVVEDERIVARELQLRLADLGYEVPTTVATAEDAIRSASECCPDLVLMDIHIRGERDGIETAEILRGRFDVPVIYLTAHSDDATIERAKQTGPLGYLLKPLKPGELRSAVEIALYKHQMNRQLRDREHWFSTTLRSIGDAVISTDAHGLVTFMNPVAETMTGWRSEDAMGQKLATVLQLVDEVTKHDVENPIARALRAGTVVKVDASMRSRDGSEHSISDSAAPIVDDQGQLLGAVLVFSDVTEQRQLRRQLELSDRLASLGTMAAGVAHEINNPLSYVLWNLESSLEVLDARAKEPGAPAWVEEVGSALREAVGGAVRVQKIVADMSVFSRPPSEARAQADCHRAIGQAIELTRNELRLRASVVTKLASVPPCRIDEARLGQVLVNLLINAAHAIEPGDPARNNVTIATEHDDRGVRIDVTDTGSGMTDEIKARIFDPFFTTKQPGSGTGLGLAICHGIISSVGGSITVESAVGAGTTFRVSVPAVDAVAEPAPPPRVTGSRARILVIDDEPVLRATLQRTLRRDHDVTAPESAIAALELLRSGNRFDLILCDLMMPDMTGMDVYEQLLTIEPEQARRVAFLTGGAFSTRSMEFLAQTQNPVIEKPCLPTALRAKLHARLGELGLLGRTDHKSAP